jgi:hypothetical protein
MTPVRKWRVRAARRGGSRTKTGEDGGGGGARTDCDADDDALGEPGRCVAEVAYVGAGRERCRSERHGHRAWRAGEGVWRMVLGRSMGRSDRT